MNHLRNELRRIKCWMAIVLVWILTIGIALGTGQNPLQAQTSETSSSSTETATNDATTQALEQYQQQLLNYYDNALKAQGQIKYFQSLTQGNMINLKMQLQSTEQDLQENEFRLELAQKFLALLQKDWLKAQSNYQTLQSQVVGRLRWLQKQPRFEGWAALLKSDNLVSFFQKRHRIRLLYESDRQQLKKIQASFATLQQRRFDIENQKNQIALFQQQLRFQKAQAETQLSIQNEMSKRLRHDRLALDAALSQIEQDSKGIGDLIRARRSGQSYPMAPTFQMGNGRFGYPVDGPISSDFGWRIHPISGTERFHSGIDFAVDYGTPIRAAAAGQVIFAGWYGGYGNAVILDHGGGVTTLYGHTEKLLVNEGMEIAAGTVIALVGSTGYSTGPHLHFEVRENGDPVDPRKYL